jgi:hypothetical protein
MVDIGVHQDVSDLVLWLSKPIGKEITISKFDNTKEKKRKKIMTIIKQLIGKFLRKLSPNYIYDSAESNWESYIC